MYKNWHRPRSIKRMIVELERPFVWPAEPENFEAWNKDQFESAQEESRLAQDRSGSVADTIGVAKDAREAMREQVKALLEGRERWKPVSGAANQRNPFVR